MIREFGKLNNEEIELLFKAPFLVCILIAGADGTIDRKEIKGAINIAQTKHKKASILTPYFNELTEDFEDKLKILIQGYPYESTQRSPLIIAELSELNKVWSKLPKQFSVEFYDVLKDIARGIALSSGGMLGMNSIGSEEAKYLQLSMIQDPGQR
jgi:hypothetical protein